MEQLLAMGFGPEARVRRQLELCDGDVDQAMELLLADADDEAAASPPPPGLPPPPTTAEPEPAPAPARPALSRPEQLAADVEAMQALVADPSSRYHALAGVFAWEAPVLSLATAGGEACTVTFDAEEYPQGAEFADHPAFPTLPPFAKRADGRTRVRQIVDIVTAAPAKPASGSGSGSGSDDGEALSIASDDDLFGSGDNSEFSEDDDDDDYANFHPKTPRGEGGGRPIHPNLLRDIEMVQRVFGAEAARVSDATFEEKVVVDLTLNISDVLRRDTMVAWKLPRDHPFINISLQLNRELYTETRHVPEEGRPDNPYFRIFCRDPEEGVPLADESGKLKHSGGRYKKAIPVCVQLCHAVLGPQSGFVKRWWEAHVAGTAGGAGGKADPPDPVTGWPHLQTARNYLAGRPFLTDAKRGVLRTVGGGAKGFDSAPNGAASGPPAAADDDMEAAIAASLQESGGAAAALAERSWAAPDDSMVDELAAVVGATGAQREAVVGALALSESDPDRALNAFFDRRDDCITVGQLIADQQADAAQAMEPEPEPGASSEWVVLDGDGGKPLARQGSSGVKTRALVRQASSGGVRGGAAAGPWDGEAGLTEEDIPESCFLLDLMCYLKLRLPTLNRYCVVSDKEHLFEPMLIPTVSCRPDAMFTFDNYDGWWNLAAEDIASQVEVVDLLVHMAKEIFRSSRWDTLLGIKEGPNFEHRDVSHTNLLPMIVLRSIWPSEVTVGW